MTYYILVLILINLIGFYQYIDYSSDAVPYRKQLVTDFFCPIGAFVGRVFFAFKLKENATGLIFGMIFTIFISIIFLSI